MGNKLNRRNFIKSAAIALGAVCMPDTIGALDQYEMLKDVCDIHVHAAPDVRNRLINELEFANAAQNAGYRSVMFKSNEWSCHDRVFLLRQILPDFACFGSLCMNRAHGDRVNVHAAKMAIKTTGNYCKCIWMPTQAAAYQNAIYKLPDKGIPVLSDTGQVFPEVVKVMELCADTDIIFATGHSSPDESLVLAQKAREVGVKKFVVTHANSHIWKMNPSQILRIADLGGFIEYSYITNLWGPGTGLPAFEPMSDKEFVMYAEIVPERSFITTDLGQVDMPHPIEGMRKCVNALINGGVSQKNIDLMILINPAMLMNI